ncbi:Putative fatty acyl-CoA reductase CG5065 [Anthophora plagiata]
MTSEGNNAYINDILDLSESPPPKEKSEIIEFFAHTNILITGGTGFLGKLLVEKLLRSCPNIEKLYITVRPRKGKTSLERFKENFDDIIYDRLKHEQPNFINKVVMLEADISQDECGLSPNDKKLLMNTNIIFHAAANVRFDEKIQNIAKINVRSTKFLLSFAKTLPNLKAFVHVSTAYSNCIHPVIDEIHYKDVDADKFLTLLDIMDDETLQKMIPILLDKWPNTYVYTKAIGENVILKYSDNLPVCIVRPSIVTSTSKEPIAAWTNNLYGYTGVAVASGIGLLHSILCKVECKADIIPADYVINTIIASAWDVANIKAANKLDAYSKIPDKERLPVYNCVSSCQNPITWGEVLNKSEVYASEIPTSKFIWLYMLIATRYAFMHNINIIIFHMIPSVIIDTIAFLIGRKPMLVDAYKKIHKFGNVIHYFTQRQWRFKNENVVKLWEKMNSVDQQNFCFHINRLNWDDYFFIQVRGIRAYMLNDPSDTIEATRKKQYKLRIIHYTVITIVALLFLSMLVFFVSYLWSLCPLSH